MDITRRDFIKAATVLGAALGIPASAFPFSGSNQAANLPPVIWLQGQGCSGCSISLLNSIQTMSIVDLLLNTINLEYHPTLMAAAGPEAIKAAEDQRKLGGYILVVEGAIPTAWNGKFCYVWDGLTMLDAVKSYAAGASHVIAVGTCGTYGGITAAKPNPTGSAGLQNVLGTTKTVVNLPGCPAHPDWVVGTVAYIIAQNKIPTLDTKGRPTLFYKNSVHSRCPLRWTVPARKLGDPGCLLSLGCKGKKTSVDCPTRKWNSIKANTAGINWCAQARTPCIGCVEPDFPDGKSPFYMP